MHKPAVIFIVVAWGVAEFVTRPLRKLISLPLSRPENLIQNPEQSSAGWEKPTRFYSEDARHSDDCVYLGFDDGMSEWCCAEDCEITRRAVT